MHVCMVHACLHGADACWHRFGVIRSLWILDGLGQLLPNMAWSYLCCKLCLCKVLRFKMCSKTATISCSHRGRQTPTRISYHGQRTQSACKISSAQNKASCGGRAFSRYCSWKRVFFVCYSVNNWNRKKYLGIVTGKNRNNQMKN